MFWQIGMLQDARDGQAIEKLDHRSCVSRLWWDIQGSTGWLHGLAPGSGAKSCMQSGLVLGLVA